MSMKEAIRLLGTIVFFFGSLQGVTQSTASRSQEVASHAGQAKEFLKEQRPDLATPEFRAIVALDPNNVDGAATSACCCCITSRPVIYVV